MRHELIEIVIKVLEKIVENLKEENKKKFPDFTPGIKELKNAIRLIKYGSSVN